MDDNILHEFKSVARQFTQFNGKIECLTLDIIHLRELIEDICDIQHNKIKIPHRCPVCEGTTFDKSGKYDELCIPCDGRGIVWG